MVVVPSRRDAVRQAVAPWDALRPGWGALHILGRHSAPAPLDLSFDVILRSRGREFAVGSFTTREVGQTSWMLPRVPDGCDERMVDVLLRPSPAEAAKHFGVQTIWGEDVLFRDVLLGPPLPIHE
jgi:hypothetical protein